MQSGLCRSPAVPTRRVVLPKLQQLLTVQNTHSITLSGLTLVHTAIACPVPPSTSSSASAGVSAGGVAGGGDVTCGQPGGRGMGGQLINSLRTTSLLLSNLTLAHSGGDAAYISNGHALHLRQILVRDAGGVGLSLSGCSGNSSVVDSRVDGAGKLVQNAAGIQISGCEGGLVTRCETLNIAHSRGLRWDSRDDAGAYTTLSYNHVHHCGCGGEECLCDGGGLDGAAHVQEHQAPEEAHELFRLETIQACLHDLTLGLGELELATAQ